MNFEKLLEQEAQRAALQDYEEVTEKTKNYSYKFSKEFIQKMNKMIYEEKRKAKKIELQKPSLPIKKCEIFEIESTTETDLNSAENKISGEYVYAYPPGSPIIAPGEVISKELIVQINELYKNGVNILSDSNLLPLKILS